jgi:uncharacterized protein YbaP (TraB family)
MKRIIVSIVLVVLVCTWASAETSVWKAQKGTSITYLGGTCHVLRESDFPLPPEFDRAYRASAIVVFETDLGKLEKPSTQQKMLAKSMYADGSTIDQHLSAPAFAQLSEYCKANGIPLEALLQFKPSMLMITLTFMELLKQGVTQQGVDRLFYDLAKKDGKAVKGLETVDEQIDFIASMADGNEDEFVTYAIRDMETLKEKYGILVDAWRSGDTEKLEDIMVTELKSRWPELYKKLITDRNRNWMFLIDGYQKTPQTEFVLVGAGHLVGPDGIIAALKKKGYKVEKL